MLARMKLSTHQYAKSQLKWIRKQLLPAVREAMGLGGDVAVYVVHGGERGETVAKGVLAGTFAIWAVVTADTSSLFEGRRFTRSERRRSP
jgi:tRNA A37 N6-isopentenylltransferase MiaA